MKQKRRKARRSRDSYISQDPEKRKIQLGNLWRTKTAERDTPFLRDLENRDIRHFASHHYILKSGQPIRLEPWQLKNIFNPLFPRSRKRTYQKAIFSMPKKNGKSELASLIIIWHLYFEPDIISPEVVGVAKDKKQSRIILNRVKKAIKRNPKLKALAKIYKDRIEIPGRDATYTVLAAGIDSSEGRDPSLVIMDEAGVSKWGLFTSLLSGQSARVGHGENVLSLVVLTAGWNLTSPFFKYFKHCEKGLEGVFCYSEHGNPASWITKEWLDQERRTLTQFEYMRYHQNIWVAQTGGYVDLEQIEQCVDDFQQPAFMRAPGCRYFAGLDLGLTHDQTAITLVHRDREGNIMMDLQRIIQGSPRNEVQLKLVAEQIRGIDVIFKPKWLIDPWEMRGLIQELKAEGVKIEKWKAKTLHQVVTTLYSVIVEAKLRIWREQALIDQLLSVVVTRGKRGLRLDAKSGSFDDRVMSLGLAVFHCSSVPYSGYSTACKPGMVVGRKTYDSKAGVSVGPSPYFGGAKPDFHDSKNFMPQPGRYKDPTLPGGTGGYERPSKRWPPPTKIDHDE